MLQNQTCVAKLIHHLVGAWDLPISTTAVSQLQQGSSETPKLQCTPRERRIRQACSAPLLKNRGSDLASDLARREETPGFLRPSAPNLSNQEHQPRSAAWTDEFWVRSFSPCSGAPPPRQRRAWGREKCRSAVDERDESVRVLSATERVQETVCHDVGAPPKTSLALINCAKDGVRCGRRSCAQTT